MCANIYLPEVISVIGQRLTAYALAVNKLSPSCAQTYYAPCASSGVQYVIACARSAVAGVDYLFETRSVYAVVTGCKYSLETANCTPKLHFSARTEFVDHSNISNK
jgi:hypothetical protein